MKKQLIQFIWAESLYNFHNPSGALESILRSILLSLLDDFDIYINDEKIDTDQKATGNGVETLHRRHPLSPFVPFRIKEKIKVRKKLQFSKGLFEIIRSNPKPDLIFELGRAGSDVGARLKKLTGAPLLVYFDAPSNIEYEVFHGMRSPFAREIDNREGSTLQNADRIIVYSNAVKDHLMKSYHLDDSQFTIYQTLDYSKLKYVRNKSFDKDKLVIGYIGSFSVWHKVHLLLDAFETLASEMDKVHLILAGKGMEYESVASRIERSPFRDRIELPGFVLRNELTAIMERIDVGIYPGSQWYNIPTKVFEYGSYGIASIVPRTPTIDEIFGDEVVFFNQDEKDSLYFAIKDLITNPSKLETQKEIIFDRIRSDFTRERAVRHYKKVISELIRSK